MRLRYNPNAKNNLQNSNYLVKNLPFSLKKNTIVELGMGKGQMLTKLAYENPELIHIGVEKYETVAEKAIKKADELNLENFKIICKDIQDINDFFKGQTDVLWLTFSDPWPKKRHEKRRLTHINFLRKYQKILTKNGVVKFKTDNDKLFTWTINHLKEHKFKTQNVTNNLHQSKLKANNISTEYEDKWKSKGKNINYLEILINN